MGHLSRLRVRKLVSRSPHVRRPGYQPFHPSLAPVNPDLGFGGSKCHLQATVLVVSPRAAGAPRSHPDLAKLVNSVELGRAEDKFN
jgi:hypothetical protein